MRVAGAIVAATLLAGCARSLAAREAPLRIDRGQPFSLRVGHWAQTSDASVRIGFDAVVSDSRCPRGEQCVRAGEAVARIWWQQGAGARQVRELQAGPGDAPKLSVPGSDLRLLRLDPYPVAGSPVAIRDYVVMLRLDSPGTALPER